MMKHSRILFSLFFIAFLIREVPVFSNSVNQELKGIVLIGWDGVQREHLKECLDRGELPNLKGLIQEGALVDIDILGTTDTKAGWAQILTGYKPEITGVFSNNNYGPIPEGYTIFERLESFYGPDNFITVAVIAKREHMGANPPFCAFTDKAKDQGEDKIGFKVLIIPAKPYYYTKPNLDYYINGLTSNTNVGIRAQKLLDQYLSGQYKGKPFLFFIHFADVDWAGHSYGENSREYNDAIICDDMWLGKIVEKLKEQGIYDKTLIYVTADHGFDEGRHSHRKAPHVFLATNDQRVTGKLGWRTDIAPTILARFGLDLDKIQPALDGKPLLKSDGTKK